MATPNPRNLTNPVQFKFNMSEDLKERLDAVIAKNGRTLSAEITDRLEKSFEAQGDDSKPWSDVKPWSDFSVYIRDLLFWVQSDKQTDDDLLEIVSLIGVKVLKKWTDEDLEQWLGRMPVRNLKRIVQGKEMLPEEGKGSAL